MERLTKAQRKELRDVSLLFFVATVLVVILFALPGYVDLRYVAIVMIAVGTGLALLGLARWVRTRSRMDACRSLSIGAAIACGAVLGSLIAPHVASLLL